MRQRGLERAHRHGGNDLLLDFKPVGWRLGGRSHLSDRHVPAQLGDVDRCSDFPADFASLAGRKRHARRRQGLPGDIAVDLDIGLA